METEAVATPLVDPLPNRTESNWGPPSVEANALPPVELTLAKENVVTLLKRRLTCSGVLCGDDVHAAK